MTTFIRETTPTAVKPHLCHLCHGRIEPGDTYTRSSWRGDDGPYDFVRCGPCDDVDFKVGEWADWPDEGYSFWEADEWAGENDADPAARAWRKRRMAGFDRTWETTA